jgi:hypothetical protein
MRANWTERHSVAGPWIELTESFILKPTHSSILALPFVNAHCPRPKNMPHVSAGRPATPGFLASGLTHWPLYPAAALVETQPKWLNSFAEANAV